MAPGPRARVAVVGDFQPENPTHGFTNAALGHVGLDFDWVATDVAGDAEHAETSPDAPRLVVTALACSLVGQSQTVTVLPGTRAARLYGAPEATEDYYCNYGGNPEYRQRLVDGGLRVSGVGGHGEIRIVELPGHPFFLATLFLPRARSAPGRPHPLLAGYAAAVAEHWGGR